MRFKIDENLPPECAELLAAAGHDASTVPEERLGGSADPQIALVCRQEGRALITLDLDFADIRHYPPEEMPGTVVMRFNNQSKPYILRIFTQMIPDLDREPLEGNLWIVEDDRIRIREGNGL